MLEDRLYCTDCDTNVELVPTEGEYHLGIQFACECTGLDVHFMKGQVGILKGRPEHWVARGEA